MGIWCSCYLGDVLLAGERSTWPMLYPEECGGMGDAPRPPAVINTVRQGYLPRRTQ